MRDGPCGVDMLDEVIGVVNAVDRVAEVG